MKKILFLILATAVLFDLAAGAYLMHLLDTRKTQSATAKPVISQSPRPLTRADNRTGTQSRPSYSIY